MALQASASGSNVVVKRVKCLCFNVCGKWLAYSKSRSTGSHYLLYREIPAEYKEQFKGFVGSSSRYIVSHWVGAWIGAKEQPRFMSRPKMDGFSHELSDGLYGVCMATVLSQPVLSWEPNPLWSMCLGITSASVDLQTMGRMGGEVEDGLSGCYPTWEMSASSSSSPSVISVVPMVLREGIHRAYTALTPGISIGMGTRGRAAENIN
ncbi:hypothetical protein DFH09DRAFT_1109824 [Mycena vulgaris]|nr:hypothetical protein DFH09DRAFT_1109824 [Mycena vulgaris]